MIVYLDIETAPARLTEDEIASGLLDLVPSNYRDPAKIAAYMEERRPDYVARTALDSMRGSICAIGWAYDREPVLVVAGDDEMDLLDLFATSIMEECAGESVTWVGHNLLGFDLPWLRRHAARYGMTELLRMLPGGPGDRWGERVRDTMQLWQSTERGPGHYALDDVARFLRLRPGKTQGSAIPGMVARGQWDQIREHCADDVSLVRQVYQVIAP